MINFNVGDLVWIPQETIGYSKESSPNKTPFYKTKKAGYGVVTMRDNDDWLKVSFWDEVKRNLLFKKKNLRKHDMEINNDKTC